MQCIVGLGNPGNEYQKTRHNVGFMCIEDVRKKLQYPPFALKKTFNSDVSEGAYKGEKVLLVRPQTFMNLSGEAVKKIIDFYKIPLKNCWVIYDDVDLPLGTIRIRASGSAGTHNGMKSIVASLGKADFPRIRIGIESRGTPAGAPAQQETSSFVLAEFLPQESVLLHEALTKGTLALLEALAEGVPQAAERYN